MGLSNEWPSRPTRGAGDSALVFQHLRLRPTAGIFCFHVPNGGARRPIEAAVLKGLGVTAGVPDVIAIKTAAPIALN